MRTKTTWLLLIAIPIAGFAATIPFIEKPPPRQLRIGTGAEGGGYFAAGEWLQQRLGKSGFSIEVVSTPGSTANVRMLRAGEIDVALVQGGILTDAEGLSGVASLYYEPLWIFTRLDSVRRLRDLAQRRLLVGQPESGTRSLALTLLAEDGVDVDAAQLLDESPDRAAASLIAGNADAMFLVSSPRAPIVERLMSTPGVRVVSLSRARAYERRFSYLQHLTLSPGMINLEKDLPSSTIEMVAPAATVVIREDMHQAIPPVLIEAAALRFGKKGLFEDPREFPSANYVDAPISAAARTYFTRGRSFLYRLFPFRIAALLDRIKILLLPALTLLLPLARFAPPLYRWRIRRRIFLWYRHVLSIEQRIRSDDSYGVADARKDLDDLQREITGIAVPLSYAEELYSLRMHVRHAQEEIERGIVGNATT